MSKKSSPNSPKHKSPSNKPSPIEESQLRCAFAMLDANHDGRVNAEELKGMLDRLGISVDDEVVKKLLSEASKNGNGLISEQEFLKWMSKMQTRSGSEDDDIEEDLKAAFHVFDREHCGFITKEDLKQAMQLIGENMTDKDLDELLRTSDLDKDGKINYEDFIKILH